MAAALVLLLLAAASAAAAAPRTPPTASERAALAARAASASASDDSAWTSSRGSGSALAAAAAPNSTLFVPMRDGVGLWTLVFLPAGASAAAPVGTVLLRTPYGVDDGPDNGNARNWPNRGFAYVEQDQRGCGKQATDQFQLWRQDGDDAHDTMEWIAAQPWSNGRVFTSGGSGAGMPIYVAANAAPPWLRAIAPGVATAHGYKTIYPGGAYRVGLIDPWMLGLGFDYMIDEIADREGESAWWDPLRLPGNEQRCTFPGAHKTAWFDMFINEYGWKGPRVWAGLRPGPLVSDGCGPEGRGLSGVRRGPWLGSEGV